MRRNGPDILRWVSMALLLAAVALFFYELVAYSRQRARFPDQLTVAGVNVGNLTQSEALEKLLRTYSSPVELYYDDQVIHVPPGNVGFQLDTDVMLAAAEQARTETPFWSGFWDFIWSRPGEARNVPLRAELSEAQLENVLYDIGARYDEPPIPAEPIPGSPEFTAGTPGRVLDVARATDLISAVLRAPINRRVNLPIIEDYAPKPNMETLEILFKQIIEVSGFDGLAVIYLTDLSTGENIHFATLNGEPLPVVPDDIAFSAASINKISIMTAFYKFFDEPLEPEAARWLKEMITESGNDPSDWLMQQIDEFQGPLIVTDTLREIGLDDTFIGGYYYLGAPLLRTYTTNANSRSDINTRPDRYTQITASDIGLLLEDIYTCAAGGGTLLAAFPGEVKPEECETMLDLLSENILGSLIKGGVPDGTRVAHKHGWRSSPLDMIGDAGIVYTPGGDYVISIFLWADQEMVWDPISELIADISKAAFNFYNPPVP
jgi:beta-lactamase class A